MTTRATMPSTPSTVATSSQGEQATFLQQISEKGKSIYAQRRPWSELLYANGGGLSNAFSKPESIAEAKARVRRHISYFRINYALIILLAVLCSLLRNFYALLAVVAVGAAWCLLYFFRSGPIVVLNRSFSEGAILAFLSVGTIVALFLTGATTTILTAVLVGAAVVLVHGAFRVSDDLFLDEEEAAERGIVAGYGPIPPSSRHV